MQDAFLILGTGTYAREGIGNKGENLTNKKGWFNSL
jgi:hypothetical protein